MSKKIVVIGGGPAGVWAAIEAKRQDGAAEVCLLSEEDCEPYEKPPLSKAVLTGKSGPELIAGKGGVTAHGIVFIPNANCTAIDRNSRQVLTPEGPIQYDTLVIATGSTAREFPLTPAGLPRVHYLRTQKQARQLQIDLLNSKKLVVIGAGLIGLEVAASAAELGVMVTIIEPAARIMSRACDVASAAVVHAEHQKCGIDIQLGAMVTRVNTQPDGRIVFETNTCKTFVADTVVIGVGVIPNDALAAAAGLSVQDGVIVDEYCRTSDPNIFAAGDVTRFPGPTGLVRLENWRHAQDQGAIAGRNATGCRQSYNAIPSFWSEQHDLYIQGVGWVDSGAQKLRRLLPDKSALFLETNDGVLTYALGINVQRDMAAIRRLVERSIPIDDAALVDPQRSFTSMLKIKV